ncbi:hypothetical protein O6H91_09G074500 [Diphasiastrum complanatum]|nr:hypothetical protein O6H91_09G074500 [Diphasiastrum complanatum]
MLPLRLEAPFEPRARSRNMSKFLTSVSVSALSLRLPAALHHSRYDPLSRSGPIDSSNKPEHRSRNKLWHSQEFERQLPEVIDFPAWLQDAIKFSKKLETPVEKWSLWNWRPFRALAHMGHRKFDFLFSMQIHAIEGLPAAFNGMRVMVQWRRKDKLVQTKPMRVCQGVVDFEQTLHLRCGVYASKNAPHAIKGFPILFTLSVLVVDGDEFVLGKHRLDFAKILPKTVDQTAKGKVALCGWTMSLKLSRKAKEATLLATVGCKNLYKDCGKQISRNGGLKQSALTSSTFSSNSLPSSVRGTPYNDPSIAHNSSPTVSTAPAFTSVDRLLLSVSVPESEPGFAKKTDAVQAPATPEQSHEYSQLNRNSCARSERDDEITTYEDEAADFTAMEQKAAIEVLSTRTYDKEVLENKQEAVALHALTEAFDEEIVEHVSISEWTSDRETLQKRCGDCQTSICSEETKVEVDMLDKRILNQERLRTRENDSVISSSNGVHLNECVVIDDGLNGGDIKPDLQGGERSEPIASERVNVTPTNDLQEKESQKEDERDKSELTSVSNRFRKKTKIPLNLDDEAELIAGEFLHMLKEESSPDGSSSESEGSPRGKLLKQLEKEAMLEVGTGSTSAYSEQVELCSNAESENKWPVFGESDKIPVEKISIKKISNEKLDMDFIMKVAELELQKAIRIMHSNARVKTLEDAETEALMQEWQFDEKSFDSLPPTMSKNPYAQPRVSNLPPLGKGLRSVMQGVDGGTFRSKNPALFQTGQRNAKLVQQVSEPVVPGAEMGCSAFEILQKMASQGVENMPDQGTIAMPFEDIGGKAMQQIAFEGQSASEDW